MGTATMGRGTTYIYHERQLGALCGVHCVNNLLQGPRFGPGDLAEIGVRLDKKERRLLGVEDQDISSCNFDASADGGNFSIQVLSVALARAGLKLLRSDHPDALAGGEDLTSVASAFMVQRRGHWYALRAAGPCWWDLDSLLSFPKALDKPAVTTRLCRLASGGHSIFLVVGKDLPIALPPAGVGTSSEGDSNWHDAFALLSPGSANLFSENTDFGEEAELGEITSQGLEAFSDDEVRAALALAGGNGDLALDFLQKARESIGSLMSSPPERLARALTAAVGAVLQARRSLPTAVARLVALLCAPAPEKLASAAALVDCGDLAHQLLTALAKKSKGFLWTEGLAQAATVAVDLLLSLPGGGGIGAIKKVPSEPSPCDHRGSTLHRRASGSRSQTPGRSAAEPQRENTAEIRKVSSPTSKPRLPPPDLDVNDASRDSIDDIFDTAALDALLDCVADEGASAGQPLVSAPGLKTHTTGTSASRRSAKNASQSRSAMAERTPVSTSPSCRSAATKGSQPAAATIEANATETAATKARPRRRGSSAQPRQYISNPS